MPKKMKLSELRRKLLERRRELLKSREELHQSMQNLDEPTTELEENAAKSLSARRLEGLDRFKFNEIMEIDNAFLKMDDNRYGRCEACLKNIAPRRLEVLPASRFCLQCATGQEQSDNGKLAPDDMAPGPDHPAEEEIEETVMDALSRNGRIDMEELNITCDNSLLYLEGTLPSKQQHRMLYEILEDLLDFDEVVDQIRIDRQPWEHIDRTPGQKTRNRDEEEIFIEEEDKQVDAYTSLETGEPMDPPDLLVPPSNLT